MNSLLKILALFKIAKKIIKLLIIAALERSGHTISLDQGAILQKASEWIEVNLATMAAALPK